MREWIDNGVRLAWLIDPFAYRAFVYRSDGSIEEHEPSATLSGEDILKGFVFNLNSWPIHR